MPIGCASWIVGAHRRLQRVERVRPGFDHVVELERRRRRRRPAPARRLGRGLAVRLGGRRFGSRRRRGRRGAPRATDRPVRRGGGAASAGPAHGAAAVAAGSGAPLRACVPAVRCGRAASPRACAPRGARGARPRPRARAAGRRSPDRECRRWPGPTPRCRARARRCRCAARGRRACALPSAGPS